MKKTFSLLLVLYIVLTFSFVHLTPISCIEEPSLTVLDVCSLNTCGAIDIPPALAATVFDVTSFQPAHCHSEGPDTLRHYIYASLIEKPPEM